MAPYNPPVSHYTELDVSEYDEAFMFSFVGKGGKRHYWMTRMLCVDYLWYDPKRKVIWGPFNVLQTRQAQELLKSELEIFKPKLGEPSPPPSQNVDTQATPVEV
jgi:hypothetical protein